MCHGASWMIASMDLNASPQPEDDENDEIDKFFREHLEEESEEPIVEHNIEHADYVVSAVEISRRVHLSIYLNLFF